MDETLRLEELLELLDSRGVEHIVVGDVAAILHGSPLTTGDLDILYRCTDENLEALASALASIEAIYLDPSGRTLRPTVERLATLRIHLLKTRLGRLDAMREIGRSLGYEDLLPRTRLFELGDRRIRVLDLEAVIESKEQTDRPKDRFQLPYLRQLRDELNGEQ